MTHEYSFVYVCVFVCVCQCLHHHHAFADYRDVSHATDIFSDVSYSMHSLTISRRSLVHWSWDSEPNHIIFHDNVGAMWCSWVQYTWYSNHNVNNWLKKMQMIFSWIIRTMEYILLGGADPRSRFSKSRFLWFYICSHNTTGPIRTPWTERTGYLSVPAPLQKNDIIDHYGMHDIWCYYDLLLYLHFSKKSKSH